MEEQVSFEQALKSLEAAVARLESGQLPLDEALQCFESGVQSAALCRKELGRVESRVEQLLDGGDGQLRVEAFRDQDGGEQA